MRRKEIGKWVLLALLGIGIFQIFLPQQEISTAERRRLAKRPEISIVGIKDGSYGEQLEAGLLDQFPGREAFRSIYAFVQQKLLGKWDVADYYIVDQNISKLDPVLEEKNVIRAAIQFSDICSNYFPDADCYYAIIPDKNYFLAEENGYPALDYERLSALMKENFTAGDEIVIEDLLELTDYYRTDLHWRQEELLDVAEKMISVMQQKEETGLLKGSFQMASDRFYGGYAGASGFMVKPDTLFYYESPMLSKVKVYDYEKQEETGIYALEALQEDALTAPYDLYLNGARALLRLENPEALSEKKLVIFRDSFTSSLAPLLAEAYSEIILVDLRYVSLSYAMEIFDTGDYDTVLFLYHTGMLNHSETLRF